MADEFDPQQVLDLWFPDDGHWRTVESHLAFWNQRMQGGMDDVICREFADLTLAAAEGRLDHWAETPRGRLALLLALDQFPRSLWRDTPKAFGQDIKATRLALEAVGNGHYAALPAVWERQFYIIAITHCEGPDHLARMDLARELTESHREVMEPQLAGLFERAVEQADRVRGIIERFGRHPHRNDILGRVSTPEERAYIEAGEFPHLNRPPANA